ncbi:MAG: hypothetical protein JWR07_3999 [Nevskia sp.]|nr:hypothetical protein [Nevskia sp.]
MRNALYLLVAVAALAGLYSVFRWQAPTTEAVSAASSKDAVPLPPTASAPPASAAADTAVELRISRGMLVSGPSVIKLVQGDPVDLRIVSDTADELHLHGYDLHLQLHPDLPASLHFIANRSGRFTYELHHAHQELGALEVYPR